MIKEERRKKARMKKLLIGLACFAVFLVIAAFIVVKVFVVKTVKVEGNALYDETLIKETVLNDEYSWNSLYVFLKYTFIDTSAVPFIDTIEVSLEDPQTLKLKVYEKGMMGYLDIASIGQLVYFDKDGFVVETSTRLIENVPKIEGISCSEVVLYEKLPIEETQLKQILTLTQDLKRVRLEPDAILYNMNYAPVLQYGNVEVWLGSMELLTPKIERLSEILPRISEMSGVLHLETWTEENRNIVFEEQIEEEITTENSEEIEGEGIVEEESEAEPETESQE